MDSIFSIVNTRTGGLLLVNVHNKNVICEHEQLVIGTYYHYKLSCVYLRVR